MKSIGTWIAALALGAAAIAVPAIGSAQAARCDAAALTCFASGIATSAGESSFLDLVRAGDARPGDHATASDGLVQPAAYAPAAIAPVSSSAEEMAPAGVGAIDSAMGTEIPNPGIPAWLALPRSIAAHAAPDASIAWIYGIGFLGFVILRRVRAAPDY